LRDRVGIRRSARSSSRNFCSCLLERVDVRACPVPSDDLARSSRTGSNRARPSRNGPIMGDEDVLSNSPSYRTPRSRPTSAQLRRSSGERQLPLLPGPRLPDTRVSCNAGSRIRSTRRELAPGDGRMASRIVRRSAVLACTGRDPSVHARGLLAVRRQRTLVLTLVRVCAFASAAAGACRQRREASGQRRWASSQTLVARSLSTLSWPGPERPATFSTRLPVSAEPHRLDAPVGVGHHARLTITLEEVEVRGSVVWSMASAASSWRRFASPLRAMVARVLNCVTGARSAAGYRRKLSDGTAHHAERAAHARGQQPGLTSSVNAGSNCGSSAPSYSPVGWWRPICM